MLCSKVGFGQPLSQAADAGMGVHVLWSTIYNSNGEELWPVIRTIPMRCSHLVYIGQDLHKNLFRSGVPKGKNVNRNNKI